MWFLLIFIHRAKTYISVFMLTFHWFSLLIVVKTSCSPQPCSKQRLLESWKRFCPQNNNLHCYGFTAAGADPPSAGLGRRQRDEITGRDVTLHSCHVSRAISGMCKSNLNPRWELLYTENPSTADEISKQRHKNGKWAIISWFLRTMKSKIQCDLNF